MPHYASFGEIMLRLAPALNEERLIQADRLRVGFSGAEANVAVALGYWGEPVDFISKVPANPLGDGAELLLRSFGVRTRHLVRGGPRIGTYFMESGASIRPGNVIYDRAGSSFATAEPADFAWETILAGKDFLHLTGITPALSPACAEICAAAARAAAAAGVTVSFDPNYRRKLWRDAADARKAFAPILEHTDVLIANEGSMLDVWGWQDESAERAMERAAAAFGLRYVAFTERDVHSADEHVYGGLWLQDGQHYASRAYELAIVDRIGGGDAFAAGLLYGLGHGKEPAELIQFATAAAALQMTVPGDLCVITLDEVADAVAGHTSGHIRR